MYYTLCVPKTVSFILQPSESAPIKVVAKCRPLTEAEKSKGAKRIVKVNGPSVVVEAAGKVTMRMI